MSGKVPEGHIMPKSSRAVRDLARKRMQLVDMRTANILSIEICMAQQTGCYLTCREIKLLTELDVDSMPCLSARSKQAA
ncbi:hypothetical protein D0T24_25000 [Duganella sp. BJB480]|nr:hypothetical protein D0T26_22835 [Duganella sp. BJB489]RFP31678.1 hypothetical protein D0T24_25000 [Duganella sp. BJB480]